MSAPGDLLSLIGEEVKTEPDLASPPDDARSRVLDALPVLDTPEAVRERAVGLLASVDPALAERIPAELPFPPEDDPLAKTAEEWEAVWYGVRESAHRVYLNMRMEFRRQLERALAGEPNDLKPWTQWVFGAACPADGEPVYGLTEARRADLGWNYPGPAADFRIYRESRSES